MNDDTIDVILFPPVVLSEKKNILPSFSIPTHMVKKFSKKALADSLTELIKNVEDIISNAKTNSKAINLESVSIAAQITANGGIQWIGNLTSGLSNAITLNFRININKHS